MEHGQDIPLNMNGTIEDINSSSKLLNGSYSPDEPMMNGDSSTKAEDATPTYADAFPPLAGGLSGPSSAKQSVWAQGGASRVKQAQKPVKKPVKVQSSDSSQVSWCLKSTIQTKNIILSVHFFFKICRWIVLKLLIEYFSGIQDSLRRKTIQEFDTFCW